MNRQSVQGLTLLEVLAVLMLLGLVLSLSLPRVQSVYNSVQLALNVEDLKQSIQRLPAKARARKKMIHLVEMNARVMEEYDIPSVSGWQIRVITPVTISSSGFCTGGELSLFDGSSTVGYEVSQPFCRLEEAGGSQ